MKFRETLKELHPSLKILYLHTILTVFCAWNCMPALLLYTTYRKWTSSEDNFFYSLTLALYTGVQIFLNPLLNSLAQKFGTKGTSIGAILISSFGFFLMAFVSSKIGFLIGYILAAFQFSLRAVRLSYISSVTTRSVRTTAVSLMPISAIIGAVLGPVSCFLLSLLPIQDSDPTKIINPYFVVFLVSCVFSLVNAAVLALKFNEEFQPVVDLHDSDEEQLFAAESAAQSARNLDELAESQAAAEAIKKRLNRSNAILLVIFLLYSALAQLSVGFFGVQLQIVATQQENIALSGSAVIIFGMAAVSVISPVITAVINGRIQDRYIIATGLIITFLGQVLFSIPPMALWQIVVGILITSFGNITWTAPTMSLFSKLIKPAITARKFTGLLFVAITLGQSIGTLISGLFDAVELGPKFLAFICFSFTAILIQLNPFSFFKLAFSPKLRKEPMDDKLYNDNSQVPITDKSDTEPL
eukprot:TRINITY_DN1143_c0_g3_i1.p1 TRINITY_DN1143_c0_g3~~TRINITY_DN1143_c0_g3_i1.p1  ORF type:complete len:471 (+),score=219.61 TRINITY_DN1143_c0_g3_i1:29-1441(+)